jgi:hypothetical protein
MDSSKDKDDLQIIDAIHFIPFSYVNKQIMPILK